jgi:GT2 family glycosyltransferase
LGGSDSFLSAETSAITAVACIVGLIILVVLLRRSRPDLRIVALICGAFVFRAIASMIVDAASGVTLYGPDQLTYIQNGTGLSLLPLSDPAWLTTLTHTMETMIFGAQIKFLHSPMTALHFTQIGLATAALTLLVASVYDLAGPRAAMLAAFVLAIEPTNVFFSAIIQKDPLVSLGEALVVFGGTKLWLRGGVAGAGSIAAGILIVLATRYYVGWILVITALAVGLHGALRITPGHPVRGNLTIAAFVVAMLVVLPVIVTKATSPTTIQRLQISQNYNATAGTGNLDFGTIDFSSPQNIVLNAPRRMVDILTRPYPWELANASQELGLLGTVVLLAAIGYFVRLVLRARSRIFEWGAPLLYPSIFLFFAYSVSAGNGGTGFRYRSHVVAVFFCLVVVLRERLAAADAREILAHPAEARDTLRVRPSPSAPASKGPRSPAASAPGLGATVDAAPVPSVSIVIVSFNSREALERCLASVRQETRSVGFEVIVVDNASSDGTIGTLRERFPWVRLVQNQENVGFARACNQGVAVARADYLLLLNSDAYITDDVIGRAVGDLEARPQYSVLGCELRFPDGRRQYSAHRALSARRSLLQSLWLYKLLPREGRGERLLGAYYDGDQDVDADWLAGAFILLRRTVFEQCGGFDERFFVYGEDIEFGMRLRARGHRILYRPRSGVVYHTGAVSSDAVWTHKQRFLRCYEGGLTAYKIVRGGRRMRALQRADLFGARVRRTVYRAALLRGGNEYVRSQLRQYEWIVDYYRSQASSSGQGSRSEASLGAQGSRQMC